MKICVKSIAIAFAILIGGCLTIDEQLSSTNPAIREKGEQRALEVITNPDITYQERLAEIQKITDQDLLVKIVLASDRPANRDRKKRVAQQHLQEPELYKVFSDRLDKEHLMIVLSPKVSGYYDWVDTCWRTQRSATKNPLF